jgi:hypothetical protein
VQTAGVGTIFGGVRTVQIARLDRFEIGGLKIERIPTSSKPRRWARRQDLKRKDSPHWRSASRCASTTTAR